MNTATAMRLCRPVRGFHRYRVREDGTVFVQKFHNGRGADKWKKVSVRTEGGVPCVPLTQRSDDGTMFKVRLPVYYVVLTSFVGKRPPGHSVRFRDGDVTNNRLDNLSWHPHHTPSEGTDRE
ncbi:HNH endonuclease [Gemmata sp.]|uniref:HNH endonuclease n=1 Tax=Gemmata sp. TaxID=1914242 RepID=UPI003F7061FA